MLQQSLKLGLIAVVLGFVAQDAKAFGRCCWRGCCGYGGCCYPGYAYGYGGWGWGYGGYVGYYGWGPVGYPVNSSGYAATSAARLPAGAASSTSHNAALVVTVPADAKVFVNGHLTKSTGERREYTSSGLLPTSVYEYRVRAEFVRDGKPVREEKTVQVTAGNTASLVFGAAPNGQLANIATTGSH